jgi:hypothetical protein
VCGGRRGYRCASCYERAVQPKVVLYEGVFSEHIPGVSLSLLPGIPIHTIVPLLVPPLSPFHSSLPPSHYLFSVYFLTDPSIPYNLMTPLPLPFPTMSLVRFDLRICLICINTLNAIIPLTNHQPCNGESITKLGLRRLPALKFGQFMTWKESDSICTCADEVSMKPRSVVELEVGEVILHDDEQIRKEAEASDDRSGEPLTGSEHIHDIVNVACSGWLCKAMWWLAL